MAESDRQDGHNSGKRGFFAFKLHQFISGAGTAYATIDPPGHRTLTVNAQQFLPEQPEKRLYPVHFCRDCGQEYHPVFLETGAEAQVLPREIDDVPPTIKRTEESDGADRPKFGFLMPEPLDGSLEFAGRDEDYPDAWLEEDRHGDIRLKADARKNKAERMAVAPTGRLGHRGICLVHTGQVQVLPELQGGASSARQRQKPSCCLVCGRALVGDYLAHPLCAALDALARCHSGDRRKMLGFTDNRQDAALQAGHFNDFLFVSLFRAAFLGAVTKAGDGGLVS
jgi:hypothetical protein